MRHDPFTVIAHWSLRSPLSLCNPTLFEWAQVVEPLSDVQSQQQIDCSSEVQAGETVRLFTEPDLLACCVTPGADHSIDILRETVKWHVFMNSTGGMTSSNLLMTYALMADTLLWSRGGRR